MKLPFGSTLARAEQIDMDNKRTKAGRACSAFIVTVLAAGRGVQCCLTPDKFNAQIADFAYAYGAQVLTR